MVDFGNEHSGAQIRTIVRPIVGLTDELPKAALESIVIEAIHKHRFLRNIAEMRHAEASRHSPHGEQIDASRIAYVRAMIDVHAQQAILSTLLDVLGYVPQIPTDESTVRSV